MRLYLSSYRLGNASEEYVKLFTAGKRVAVFLNAQDGHDPDVREQRKNEEFVWLNELGLRAEEVDLRDYFGKQDELGAVLKRYDGIWLRGGNCFLLRKAMRASGFDELIVQRLKDDDIVYGGYSAGVCVLGPSLHGLELCDEPELEAEGYEKEIIWDGLGILQYTIVPHYKSDHPESLMIDDVVEYLEKEKIEYRTLKDGQAIVIDGAKEEIVG